MAGRPTEHGGAPNCAGVGAARGGEVTRRNDGRRPPMRRRWSNRLAEWLGGSCRTNHKRAAVYAPAGSGVEAATMGGSGTILSVLPLT